MPTPPVVPSVCRFKILGTLANLAPWGVRIYTAYAGGPPSSATMLALAEGVAAAWNSHCVPLQANSVTTTAVDAVDLSSTSGASATADVDYAGGVSAAQVDNQIAAIIKMEIDRRYRGGKPKMYFPGVSVDAVADTSHFTTTFANSAGTAFAAFDAAVTALSSGGVSLANIVNCPFYKGFTAVENMITGRWRNVPKYVTTVVPDIVNSFTCDTLMGSQKRRRTA